MKTNVLGFPRIGKDRELKKACEAYWKGSIDLPQLKTVGAEIRKLNWQKQQSEGIDLIPSNDFSYYDQVLDLTVSLGAIPERYKALKENKAELYFAMAHGIQKDGKDIIAMEMTKWFDTNYHYIVPEFVKDQQFSLFDTKAVDEFNEAKSLGITTKPVVIGPVSYLLLGKEKEGGFSKIDLLDNLLPAYIQLLKKLEEAGAEWIQLDEPYLSLDIDEKTRAAYKTAYDKISRETNVKIILTTYFEGLRDNEELALSLPVTALHVDLVRSPRQLDTLLPKYPGDKLLSIGVVDGRNIWKNDFTKSLKQIKQAVDALGEDRVIVSGSCSFLHVPYDLSSETNEKVLTPEIKDWLAFAYQKVEELATLKELSRSQPSDKSKDLLAKNIESFKRKAESTLIHDNAVKQRLQNVKASDYERKSPFAQRSKVQHERLALPLFPTTTIGSFPQTKELRQLRSQNKKGILSDADYKARLEEETVKCIKWQEEIGLDVLVHGEFERNDMVEYFGEQLKGFTFTSKGWVQSYGSRCVKPPVIYGDVSRPNPMTVDWSTFAQSKTSLPMKGMLTGPVTILEWSFVRNDQPRSETCKEIALAIRDEVLDLESAGIKVIQIDEPAIREGLPLRKNDWSDYLKWSVDAFRLSAAGVKDETQVHTHMCYSEFNDIIEHIARMDADVITIECSRSQMELLDVFREFKYPNEIGPGVYDIHSARVPEISEMVVLLQKAAKLIPYQQLWVNPDCGLKTRGWEETDKSLRNMIEAARQLRKQYV